MLDFLLSSDAIMALLTLTFLEIILGIDNIVFISIAANKLPEKQRKRIGESHYKIYDFYRA